jgi:hypothetical protein
MEYSENMQHAQNASALIRDIIALIEEFEAGSVTGRVGTVYTLTAGQITTLKQAFAAKRTEIKAELDAISDA